MVTEPTSLSSAATGAERAGHGQLGASGRALLQAGFEQPEMLLALAGGLHEAGVRVEAGLERGHALGVVLSGGRSAWSAASWVRVTSMRI